MTPSIHDCHYDEQIQSNARKIERLETRSDYKEHRLDEIDKKIERMDKKIDALSDNINQLILQSNKGDNVLEKRLVAIETELDNNKQAVQDNRNRFTLIISIITIFFTALTFIFNFLIR